MVFSMNVSAPNGSDPLTAIVQAINATGNGSAGNGSALKLALNASSTQTAVVVPPALMLHLVLAMAVIVNSFLYISPLSLAMRALREQVDLKQLATWLVPTYLIFAQSYFWACYGYSVGNADIARFNALGALACMAYLALVARCAQPCETVQPAILTSMFLLLTLSVGIVATTSPLTRGQAFGHAATLCNLGILLLPLRDAARVVKTGALDEFPLIITVASFFSSLLWTQYAVFVHDQLFLFPNLIGAVVNGAELLAIYSSVWGGGSLGVAQSLLEVESQPLMPRARGKNAMDSYTGILSCLSNGPQALKPRRGMPSDRDSEFGLPDYARGKVLGFSWQKPEASVPKPAFESKPMKNSPFSARAHADSLEGFAECNDEPEFEPQGGLDANAQADQFAFIDSESYQPIRGAVLGRGYTGANGALDCIL